MLLEEVLVSSIRPERLHFCAVDLDNFWLLMLPAESWGPTSQVSESRELTSLTRFLCKRGSGSHSIA